MINALAKENSDAVETDSGFFHLTPQGWIRKDFAPYPPDRVETWQYDMERPNPDDKQRAHLTRIWLSTQLPDSQMNALRARFGDALLPMADRHLTIDCRV